MLAAAATLLLGAVAAYAAFGTHGLDIVGALNRDAAFVSIDSFPTEIAHLFGRAAIAAEQNEADRIGGAKEITFRGGKTLAGASQDNRERCVIGQ